MRVLWLSKAAWWLQEEALREAGSMSPPRLPNREVMQKTRFLEGLHALAPPRLPVGASWCSWLTGAPWTAFLVLELLLMQRMAMGNNPLTSVHSIVLTCQVRGG